MRYVALLRGIGPANPNMKNEKLRDVFESLGFTGVASVISSGNILFESEEPDTTKIETIIERALSDRLGIPGETIVRSESELKELVNNNPFGNQTHSSSVYQTVTFFKQAQDPEPFVMDGVDVRRQSPRMLACVHNPNELKSTSVMHQFEKHFGKLITTRTYKTVQRIVEKWV